MPHHFECPPFSGNPGIEPLIFDWDEAAGTVSGPSADVIRRIAQSGGVPLHPLPAAHVFSATPLRRRADLAAIIGHRHRLPDALRDDYPAPVDGAADPDYADDRPDLTDADPAREAAPPEIHY